MKPPKFRKRRSKLIQAAQHELAGARVRESREAGP